MATDFAVTRLVSTGSWVTYDEQGRGYGTKMRAGILDLAFRHLGALEAHTDYLAGNAVSERVSRKLGYAPKGRELVSHGGDRCFRHAMYITGATYSRMIGRYGPISVEGVAPCTELFGRTN